MTPTTPADGLVTGIGSVNGATVNVTGGPNGQNKGVHMEEMFSGEIGQIGTQLDGLGHIGVRMFNDEAFTVFNGPPRYGDHRGSAGSV